MLRLLLLRTPLLCLCGWASRAELFTLPSGLGHAMLPCLLLFMLLLLLLLQGCAGTHLMPATQAFQQLAGPNLGGEAGGCCHRHWVGCKPGGPPRLQAAVQQQL